MRQYWLPSTLSRYSQAKDLLIQELSARDSYLPVLIAVYRECRKLSSLKALPVDCLKLALMSSNDEMRADIISLICVCNFSS